jgi:site-specific DNA-methyltransferase (adenine-specific)
MKLINADCIQAMREMAENSIDSIVTDPPYELGFMGKKWDSSGIAFNVEVWKQALRVLKPGGHLLAFSGSRTYHRMVVAIEDAGFEIRDQIMWIYGSGFPKSHDISKGIDKRAGVERVVVGEKISPDGIPYSARIVNKSGPQVGGNAYGDFQGDGNQLTAPTTDKAKQWEGWGTALKPAHEPIVVARKPLIGTVAENVLEHGVGGLNIDGCRIGTEKLGGGTMPNLRDVGAMSKQATGIDKLSFGQNPRPASRLKQEQYTGRWPANIIFDEQAAKLVDEQSGISKSQGGRIGKKETSNIDFGLSGKYEKGDPGFGDTGGASRFFYCAKASKRDRNEGLDNLPEIQTTGGGGLTAELREDGSFETASAGGKYGSVKAKQTNFHPTVKPTSLMRYLVRLVTPPNGLVLDPFMGSGSTGKACALEHFDFVGIELNAEYIKICEARIENALQDKEQQQELF